MTTQTAVTIRRSGTLAIAGQVANQKAQRAAFTRFTKGKADNTRKRYADDLKRFQVFLAAIGLPVDNLATDPLSWSGVTWGIVEAFKEWMERQGDAIRSINMRLSTVRVFARLAAQAGTIAPDDLRLIESVKGYKRSEGVNIDKRRETTRRGTKKATWTKLTARQIEQLKAQPDTPQGRRDAVMIGLLLSLGFRVGEVVSLCVNDVDLESNTIKVYRSKVGLIQTHQLTNGLLAAMRAYLATDAGSGDDPLLRASSKSGKLTHAGMTRFGIQKRIQQLGLEIGVDNLSPHDLRHAWATKAVRNGTPIDRLMDAGGWATPAMPLAYIEREKIANAGVKSDD